MKYIGLPILIYSYAKALCMYVYRKRYATESSALYITKKNKKTF